MASHLWSDDVDAYSLPTNYNMAMNGGQLIRSRGCGNIYNRSTNTPHTQSNNYNIMTFCTMILTPSLLKTLTLLNHHLNPCHQNCPSKNKIMNTL